VRSNISITGNAVLQLFPESTLKLYAGDNTQITNNSQVLVGGRGIINPGDASNFQFYALHSITSVGFTQDGPLSGLICAPNASVLLGGGGAAIREFSGCCLSSSIGLAGHINVPFDEALLRNGPIE